MKRNVKYTLLSLPLHALACLPMRVLYAFADVAYVAIYKVAGYRRAVVRDNIAKCFPCKSVTERKAIERQFYRNFADYVFETIKLMHISDAEMSRRMTFDGVEIIDDILASGRPVAAYFAHTFNWEWAPSIILHSRLRQGVDAAFCQVYRPLRNEVFDRMMLRVRGRFGAISIPKAMTLRHLLQLRADGLPSVTGFMADQKPSHGDPTHVTTFLGRPTAMISGTETLARRMGMAAVYWHMSKTARGHYHISVRLMAPDASQMAPGDLTELYARLLEHTITESPGLWLWSHKRWKHPVRLPEASDKVNDDAKS